MHFVLEPVLSHNEKSCIVSYKLSVSHKTGFNLIIFLFDIHGNTINKHFDCLKIIFFIEYFIFLKSVNKQGIQSEIVIDIVAKQESLFIASYYRQLSTDTKINIIRSKPVLLHPRGQMPPIPVFVL